MSGTAYLLVVVLISGLVTFALRAVPFAILKPLRRSRLVQAIGRWMPAGIMVILVVVLLRDEILARPGDLWKITVATAVTIAVHLLTRRRALWSIAAGTACYIVLLNAV